jgi:hypothetical protein
VKIKKFSQMFHPLVPKLKSWVFVAYIIMAAYLIVDGAVYLTTPYSGRISTLICSENEQGYPSCTTTIFGFKEIHQRSFLVKNVIRAIAIHDWHGSSDQHVCGISIKTYSNIFGFVHPYQRCRKITKTVEKINDMFTLGDYSHTKRIIYFGFNSSLYRRAFLLVVLFIILRWGRPWSLVPMQIHSQENNFRTAFKLFATSWWKTNILLKVFFYLSIFFVSGYWAFWAPTEQGDFCRAYNFWGDPCNFCVSWYGTSFEVLLSLYPLIAFAILQAYVQWKFLREKLPITGWWIAAPIIASFTLVFGLPADLPYGGCSDLKHLLSGVSLFLVDSPIAWNLVIYLLLVGGIQWLVLCSRLSYSSGWIFMPLINVSLVSIFYLFFQNFHNLSTIVGLTLFLVILILAEFIPSVYLPWVMYSKNPDDAGR